LREDAFRPRGFYRKRFFGPDGGGLFVYPERVDRDSRGG